MTERKAGARRLQYDKPTRSIVTVVRDLIMCRGCNQPVNKDWAYCPYCGSQDHEPQTEQKV